MTARMCLLTGAALLAAACGNNGGPDAPAGDGETTSTAPTIGTDMQSPVANPFCYFAPQGAEPLTGEDARYVFVTKVSESLYHGYARLDGAVTRLTEIEAGFGAGRETRRYISDDDSTELELILLETAEPAEGDDVIGFTGSLRVIYPVEGEAVKLYGECRLESGTE